MDTQKFLKEVSASREIHDNFLSATEKNLSYFFWGKDQEIVTFKKGLFSYGDFISAMESVAPSAFNPSLIPLQIMFQEMGNSKIKVRTAPTGALTKVDGAFEFGIELSQKLTNMFENFSPHGLTALFEMINHSYMVFYLDAGHGTIHSLSCSDFYPGDSEISDLQSQPFVVRLTSPRKELLLRSIPNSTDPRINSSAYHDITKLSELTAVPIIDIWSKAINKRIFSLPTGEVLFEDEMPDVKTYPFFKASDNLSPNRWYTMPIMSKIRPLLEKYKKVTMAIDHATHAQARPLLVYDEEASINIPKLKAQLQEGGKNILVGKSEIGDIRYKQPGQLPEYVFAHQANLLGQINQLLGIAGMARVGAVREKGAVEAMIRSSLRQFIFYSNQIRGAIVKASDYYTRYVQTHRLQFLKEFNALNSPSPLWTEGGYKSEVEVLPSVASRTSTEQAFILRKNDKGLISKEQALRELGYSNPDRQKKELNEEILSQKKLAEELKRPSLSLRQEVEQVLGPVLGYVPDVLLSGDSKAVVSVNEKDVEKSRFLLGDINDRVYIDGSRDPETKSEEVESMRDRVSEQPAQPPMEAKQPTEQPVEQPAEQLAEQPAEEPVEKAETTKEEAPKEAAPKISKFKQILEKLIEISKVGIKKEAVGKFISKYPGIYLADPAGNDIYSGKKLMIVKSRLFDIIDKPHILLGGKFAYGVIVPRLQFKMDKKRFLELEKYHLISDKQRKEWWDNKPLHGYLFEFHKFEEPVEWERKPGVKNFVKAPIPLRTEHIGVPYTGDLKPMNLTPFKIPPPAKPEKKAFQPYEIFSPTRLKDVIPVGTYNVSEKIDGIRTFCWKVGDKVKFFTDTGNEINAAKLTLVADSVRSLFKTQDVLLDGELGMKGAKHESVTGFVSKTSPTPEEKAAVEYITWDILYLNGKSLADKPFIDRYRLLNLKIKPGQAKGKIRRVKTTNASRDQLAKATKTVTSPEGVVIRDIDAAYWATHAMYKMKKTADLDVKIIHVEKTKNNLPVFHCALRDGTYMGQTYAQGEVKAIRGDVIRVMVDHFTIRPDGSIGWFAPRPKNIKSPGAASLKQKGIGSPDTIAFVKEHYLSHSGTEEAWNKWFPAFKAWRIGPMKKIISKLKE